MTGSTPTPLADLDFALRAGLVSLMLFLGAVVWRDQRHSVPGRLAAALALGIAAYALQSSPAFWAWPPVVRVPLALLSTGNAVVFWLFARAVFDDDFQLRAVHALSWAVLAAAALFYRLPGAAPTMGLLISLGTVGFTLLALVQTVDSWRADLVEGRRRLRVFMVASGALYSLTNMGMRLVVPASMASLWQGPADMAVLSAIVVLAAWRIVGADPAVFRSTARPSAITVPPPAPDIEPADAAMQVDPAEQALLEALDRVMQHDRVYREEGLTIAVLARRLAVPEYRLRRAINQRLGHRNFNAFLNGQRLAEVKQALLDPARAQEPVLSLALEAGFQSLGPFNRAFKADTGLTPTEFRRAGGC